MLTQTLAIMGLSVLKGVGYLMPFIGLSFGAAIEENDNERYDYGGVVDLGTEPY